MGFILSLAGSLLLVMARSHYSRRAAVECSTVLKSLSQLYSAVLILHKPYTVLGGRYRLQLAAMACKHPADAQVNATRHTRPDTQTNTHTVLADGGEPHTGWNPLGASTATALYGAVLILHKPYTVLGGRYRLQSAAIACKHPAGAQVNARKTTHGQTQTHTHALSLQMGESLTQVGILWAQLQCPHGQRLWSVSAPPHAETDGTRDILSIVL